MNDKQLLAIVYNSYWHWLKVIIRRFSGVEQPREGELEGCGIALH